MGQVLHGVSSSVLLYRALVKELYIVGGEQRLAELLCYRCGLLVLKGQHCGSIIYSTAWGLAGWLAAQGSSLIPKLWHHVMQDYMGSCNVSPPSTADYQDLPSIVHVLLCTPFCQFWCSLLKRGSSA